MLFEGAALTLFLLQGGNSLREPVALYSFGCSGNSAVTEESLYSKDTQLTALNKAQHINDSLIDFDQRFRKTSSHTELCNTMEGRSTGYVMIFHLFFMWD